MNKIIFQIGGLAFCISLVGFGAGGYGMMDMVYRSFIVFVCVVLMCAILYTIATTVSARSDRNHAAHEGRQPGLQNIRTEKPQQQSKVQST
jgi:uncharacterized membrane protein